MTGKEALKEWIDHYRIDCYKYCGDSFLEKLKVIEKDLDKLDKVEEKLTECKRAFEILKNNCHISNYVVDGVNSGKKITFDVIREWYDKEEYELLEELMKGE